MLTSEPLVSIDVHNMRENPSLVPEKMVAFKNKNQQGRKKKGKKLFGQKESVNQAKRSPDVVKSAECSQVKGNPHECQTELLSPESPHGCFRTLRVLASPRLNLVSCPLRREHKMLYVKPHSGHTVPWQHQPKQQRA